MEPYKRIYLGKNENKNSIFQQEHRYIMEQHLGRKLKKDEIVHHINGNKRDNRIENLQVMSRSEHIKVHKLPGHISKESIEKIRQKLKHKPSSHRKKTKDDIVNIILKYKEFKNYRKVDRFFGFSNGTTGNIIRGNIYYDYQPLIKEILNNKI